MNQRPPDAVQRRNALLIIGAIIAAAGSLVEPGIPALFTTQRGALHIVMAIAIGGLFATGLTHVGETALRSPIEPWYARPGAPLLIMLMNGGVIIAWMLEQKIVQQYGRTPSPEGVVRLLTCIGLGMILSTVLNWVSYE